MQTSEAKAIVHLLAFHLGNCISTILYNAGVLNTRIVIKMLKNNSLMVRKLPATLQNVVTGTILKIEYLLKE